ncbi:hypothetical protein DSO57_1029281 [Entomophthora muscae]|uniref:Uncharacterized protein n=2 Tax=Entomophthora muscae TaxID=34485 RepID=A0ACC2TDG5_9FUNG|nr:hypothetical protein DSO57_1029281 [Entomophthora muscae]
MAGNDDSSDTVTEKQMNSSGVSKAKELVSRLNMVPAKESKQPKPALALVRRVRVGERLEEAFAWPQAEFEDLESPCSLQEYLQDIVRRSPQNLTLLLRIPDAQSPDIWLYEHLRQLCLELTYLVVQLQTECTSEKCPVMKASEWFYLCASHAAPQGCCAIDYIVHTLDGATSLLNSAKYFPSRISVPNSSIKHFLSISRRLYRIFAHTWYHHKEIFDEFENETHLYARFMGLSAQYELIPESLINIPSTDPKPQSALNVNDNPLLSFGTISREPPSETERTT